MNYTVIYSQNYNRFLVVQQHLDQGWIPQGGISVCQEGAGDSSSADVRYYQAMIKP